MPEIWENPFANAHLKVDRANYHIDEIGMRLKASSDSYGLGMHIIGSTGERTLGYYYSDRSLRPDLALIVGDAFHNLHSALDIVWGGAVGNLSPHAVGNYTKFPIYPEETRDQLKDRLLRKQLDPRLIDLVVDGVKSHREGDADILGLHKLDIVDKHVLLAPMVTATAIEGVEIENEDGSIERLDISIPPRPRSYSKVVSLETRLKNHGEVRFNMTFREGTPFEKCEVVPTLKRISWKVSRIVRALQRMAQNQR